VALACGLLARAFFVVQAGGGLVGASGEGGGSTGDHAASSSARCTHSEAGKVSGDSLSGRRGASTIIPDLACGRRREYGVRCVVEARDLRFGKFYEVVSDWAWRGL
jgi:hypothetical protein